MRLREAPEEIEDTRKKGLVRHSLSDILMMCLIGFICGIQLIEDIVFFFETNYERLCKIVPLKNGVPDRATVYRVLAMLDDRKFEALMVRIMAPYIAKVRGVVAVDGKKVRGSAAGGGTTACTLSRHGLTKWGFASRSTRRKKSRTKSRRFPNSST